MDRLTQCETALGLSLDATQRGQLDTFLAEISKYDEHTNLVASAAKDILIKDHVIDALSLVPMISESMPASGRLIDVGSGAGFPGLILAIALPSITVHLVDSVGKKTRFLMQAVDALKLNDRVVVHTGRAEQFAHDKALRETFQFATARAVGKLDLLAELCLPFLQVGGKLLAQKSQKQAPEEIDAAIKAIETLGGKYMKAVPVEASLSERSLVVVVIEKLTPTARQFPRATAQLKKPL